LAQCNGQGPAYKEGEILRAIQGSIADRDELIWSDLYGTLKSFILGLLSDVVYVYLALFVIYLVSALESMELAGVYMTMGKVGLKIGFIRLGLLDICLSLDIRFCTYCRYQKSRYPRSWGRIWILQWCWYVGYISNMMVHWLKHKLKLCVICVIICF